MLKRQLMIMLCAFVGSCCTENGESGINSSKLKASFIEGFANCLASPDYRKASCRWVDYVVPKRLGVENVKTLVDKISTAHGNLFGNKFNNFPEKLSVVVFFSFGDFLECSGFISKRLGWDNRDFAAYVYTYKHFIHHEKGVFICVEEFFKKDLDVVLTKNITWLFLDKTFSRIGNQKPRNVFAFLDSTSDYIAGVLTSKTCIFQDRISGGKGYCVIDVDFFWQHLKGQLKGGRLSLSFGVIKNIFKPKHLKGIDLTSKALGFCFLDYMQNNSQAFIGGVLKRLASRIPVVDAIDGSFCVDSSSLFLSFRKHIIERR